MTKLYSLQEDNSLKRICVFCGSQPGARPAYVECAQRVGGLLASRGIGLVFGAGRVGLMGALATAVLTQGGEAIGVIPDGLLPKEPAHLGLTKLHVVGSMHERKALMAELADAFITLPGGFGTQDEFWETLTWAQLGLHEKPCGILNLDGYYDYLLAHIERAISEGFVRPEYRSLILVERDPERLLDLLLSYRPPKLNRWITQEEA
jgi:uncharacterized protein (TIGR00730 family)